MPLKAFLLCAGLGKRFAPYTRSCPKPLLPFLNVPLTAYNICLLKSLQVSHFAANTHAHPGPLQKALKAQALKAGLKAPVFSHEPSLLGSAGGLWKVKSFLEKEEDFYYLNGDSLFFPLKGGDLLQDFYASHRKSRARASFLCVPTTKKTSVIFSDRNHRVGSFLHPVGEFSKPCHFVGLALFSRKVLEGISPGMRHIFREGFEPHLTRHLFRVYMAGTRWEKENPLWVGDMNQLSTYLKAHQEGIKLLLKGGGGGKGQLLPPPAFLHRVLNLFSPAWDRYSGINYLSATPLPHPPPSPRDFLFCGPEVRGLRHLRVKGFAVIGRECVFSPGVRVKDSVVHQKIRLNCSVEKSLLL